MAGEPQTFIEAATDTHWRMVHGFTNNKPNSLPHGKKTTMSDLETAALDSDTAAADVRDVPAKDVSAADVTGGNGGHTGPLAPSFAYLEGPSASLPFSQCGGDSAPVGIHSASWWPDFRLSVLRPIPFSA